MAAGKDCRDRHFSFGLRCAETCSRCLGPGTRGHEAARFVLDWRLSRGHWNCGRRDVRETSGDVSIL
eukprot:4728561-Pyramimonas_sp.AAC.1